ncbi:MAG: acyltransferase family protein, partial [Caulobacteraceae bacterium]
AAISVVGYHISQWTGANIEVARAGVDVFFVISGFIMWRIAGSREERPVRFLWRRASRILPPYWAATLLLLGIATIWPAFLPKVQPRTAHVLLSLALLPHLNPVGQPFPLLAPGWTLCYEAGFYLVFAAALLAPRQRRPAILFAVAIALIVIGLSLADPVYVLGANPIVLEFLFGVWIGRAAEAGRLPGPTWSSALALLGAVILIVYGVLQWRDETWRFLTWGVPAAAIVAGAVGLDRAASGPRWRMLTVLGDASYSIYLFHTIAVAAIAHLVGERRTWLFVPLAMTCAIAAGIAGRALIEKPLLAWLRGRTDRFPLSSL